MLLDSSVSRRHAALALLPCAVDDGAARRNHGAQLARGVEIADRVDGSDRLDDQQNREIRCGGETVEQRHEHGFVGCGRKT